MTNLFDLTGRKALVTGGTRGLGRGMAEGLIAAGADVVVIGRSAETGALAAAMGARGIQADLGDRVALRAAFAAAVEILAGLDILLVNHGITHRHPAAEFPIEDWDEVLEVNLTSMFLLNQLAGRHMLAQGQGKIINVASLLSYIGGITVPAYAAAKGGVARLTMALANEWAGRGVNVNAIAPGYMATDLTEALQNDPERAPAILARIPAGRWGQPADLAGVAIFLASDAAAYVHGTIIPVDGGWLGR